jgi:hypothetical protein
MIITPISNRRHALKRFLCLLTTSSSLPLLNSAAQDTTSHPMTTNPRLHSFIGGLEGPWQVTSQQTLIGENLPAIERLSYLPENIAPLPANATWILRGVTSNERYVTRPEKEQLLAKQQALGRPEAACGVLIPIKKNDKWWALTQDERRQIFEEQSHHNKIGMDYLPAIARRLHHCRDLTSIEPFDFLTWFEFAEEHTAAFNSLLTRLRSTEEWKYVEREVEVRVTKA